MRKLLVAIVLVVAIIFAFSLIQLSKPIGLVPLELDETETAAAEEECRLPESTEFKQARSAMVAQQLAARDIVNEAVLKAMNRAPRHNFVLQAYKGEAYNDYPLPIDYGQTISQPYIVALMTQELQVEPDYKVLEIGTGSGYQAAVLAELVKEVYSIEIIPELAQRAEQTLEENCYKNVSVLNADGYFGWPEHAPFDAIIVTAAATHVPQPLIEQLKDGGRLIIPLGSTLYYQNLTLITKKGNEIETEYITSVRFVPMTGEMQK